MLLLKLIQSLIQTTWAARTRSPERPAPGRS